MFSVIIPVYNKYSTLQKCLDSVCSQSLQAFEIILVNDGSTDSSPELINRFARSQERCRVISQANQGVSVARNKGIAASRYDYIAFLDADDWWEPTYLEQMKELIAVLPEAGIYGSDYFILKNGRKYKSGINLEDDFTRGLINYLKLYAETLSMPLWTGSTIVKKAIFTTEKGFNPGLKLGEDFDLWIRIALNHPVAFLNAPLACYNQDADPDGRAVSRLHNPAHHVLWNLGYLEQEEKDNRELKQLLDNLRVYNMFPYYLSDLYREDARRELAKVDWSCQPKAVRNKYEQPLLISKVQERFMLTGSWFKQRLIRVLHPGD